MAKAVMFPEANIVLNRPEGMTAEECSPLPAWSAPGYYVSKWKLSPEELAEVNETGIVWLFIYNGSHPPVRIDGNYPFVSV